VIEMKIRIKDLRTDNDLTQAEIASAIGITQRKYSYLETGRQQLTDDLLVRLAVFYKTSIDYLLGLTDDPRPYPRSKRQKM
jgi:transcriptional regulator with XRE-family HTH domain